MKIIYKLIIVFLVFVLLLNAENYAGKYGAEILNMNIHAKAKSMGGGFSAAARDIQALEYNPALLSQLNKMQIGFSHIQYIADIKYDSVELALPLLNGVAGFSGLLMHMPGIPEIEMGRITQKEMNVYDYIINGGYAFNFLDNFSFGLTGKILKRSMDDYSAFLVLFDTGLAFSFSGPVFGPDVPYENNLVLNAFIKNINPELSINTGNETTGMNIAGGLAYTPLKYFTITTDVVKEPESMFINSGLEMIPAWYISPRIGYTTASGISSYSAGVGIAFDLNGLEYEMDYAFDPLSSAGINHWISMNIKAGTSERNADSESSIFVKDTDTLRVVIFNFENTSKDNNFAYLASSIPGSISEELKKMDYITVLSENNITGSILKKYNKIKSDSDTEELIYVARKLNCQAAVTGYYTIKHDQLILDLEIVNSLSGEVLNTIRKQIDPAIYEEYSQMLDELNKIILQEIDLIK